MLLMLPPLPPTLRPFVPRLLSLPPILLLLPPQQVNSDRSITEAKTKKMPFLITSRLQPDPGNLQANQVTCRLLVLRS
jgi:hypothetical protein